ncbi:MAG: hypothetical protein JKY81_12085 [Colwellia sp.]|nr:hypothetical protein [Colwellia sp.]
MSTEQTSLTPKDLIILNRTGENLKKVIRALIREFPQSAQSITGMSQWLNYNRSNCQRVLNAVHKSINGKDVLCLLPGIASLEEFIDKVSVFQLDKQLILETKKAIEIFSLHTKQYAKSHAQLKRLLNNSAEHVNEKQEALTAFEKRQQHYLCSKQLFNSSVDTLFSSYILTQNNHNKEFLQEVALVSKLGISRSKEAPPFVQFYTHPNPDGFIRPEHITKDSTIDTRQFHIGIIDEYSDPQLAKAYSSYSASNSGIVFNELNSNKPFNASFLFSNPDELANPLVHESKCSSTSISIKNPTKKLVMMVFLDKKLDMRSSVNIGCYSSNQRVEEGKLRAEDMWTERLPELLELAVLQSSSARAQSIEGLQVGEMNDYLFNFAQLNKQDFVCYMMEVDYPIWSSTYRIYFEHC